MESGRHAIESTSRLLKRLDLTGISISEYEPKDKPVASDQGTAKPATPTFGGQREADPLGNSRRSFDPYNSRSPARPSEAPAPGRATKPRVTQPPATTSRQGLFSRLFSSNRK